MGGDAASASASGSEEDGGGSGDDGSAGASDGDASDGDAPLAFTRRAGAGAGAGGSGRGGAGGAGADEDEAEPTPGDAFTQRLEAELSEADVAALRAAAAARVTWREAGKVPGLAAAPGAVWELDGPGELPTERGSPTDYPLPAGLLRRWAATAAEAAPAATAADAAAAAAEPAPPRWASPLQRNLFALLHSYRDVLFTARELPPAPAPAEAGGPPAGGVPPASDDVLDACVLHALSHVLKTRARILHNTERLRKRAQTAAAGGAGGAIATEAEVPQDQGFARPKVLILLPMRSHAKRWLDRALALLPAAQGAADAVAKRERYEIEYGPRLDEAGANPRSLRGKPADFRARFAGNRDDHFRMGVKLTRKSVRLFADFAGADLILASPLGLATRLEAGDAGFLSSIELMLVDGADVMLMQNWSHVATVFAALNGLPKEAPPGCEIMRVRPWYLHGWAAHYRQTVLLAAHAAPQLAALLRQACANAAGRARLRAPQPGVLGGVLARAQQEFTRVAAPDAAAAADARFAAFKARVWPRLRESRGAELLFVPSYFDFVRVRNFLKAADASFVANSEYADASAVGRARADFSGGDVRIMLYSERAHYFRRHTIRGARRLTFYAPPDNAECYPELVNALEPGPEPNDVSLLFTRWDGPALERLVGTPRAQRMLRDAAPAYIFC